MSGHIARLIDLHDAAERQTVLPLVQGADSVGQLMGKHGNHPVYQIDAGSPLKRFLIQRTVLRHVMADIRNMDAQCIYTILLRYGNGVIQVFRILAVDGDRLQAA